MEIGFLLDHTCMNRLPTLWVKGPPERSFWTLTRIKGKILRRVETYRFVKCGFLESDAESDWKGWPKS